MVWLGSLACVRLVLDRSFGLACLCCILVCLTIVFSLLLMGLYQSHALKRKRLNYFVRNERAGGVGERAISSSIYFMFMLLWLLPYTYTHSLLLPPFFVSFSSFFLSFSAIGLE